jgi:hypothetical protein
VVICSLQFDSAPPGTHAQNQAKVDVLTLLGNVFVTQQLNDLEQLLQVQILSAGDNVDHVIKVVLLILHGKH